MVLHGWCLSLRLTFSVHPCYSTGQCFIPVYCWRVLNMVLWFLQQSYSLRPGWRPFLPHPDLVNIAVFFVATVYVFDYSQHHVPTHSSLQAMPVSEISWYPTPSTLPFSCLPSPLPPLPNYKCFVLIRLFCCHSFDLPLYDILPKWMDLLRPTQLTPHLIAGKPRHCISDCSVFSSISPWKTRLFFSSLLYNLSFLLLATITTSL